MDNMTLDEAIKHAEEVAEENQAIVDACDYYGNNMAKCDKCAKDHRQLARWLKDYKRLLKENEEQDAKNIATAFQFGMALGFAEKCDCDDCISRQAVLDYIYNDLGLGDEENGKDIERQMELERSYRYVKSLPPVKPQEQKTGWIPVSKRLPEENKAVIASTKYGIYPEARYTKENGWEWAYESGADYWEELEYVEAWMPLPKSYEPQERE